MTIYTTSFYASQAKELKRMALDFRKLARRGDGTVNQYYAWEALRHWMNMRAYMKLSEQSK